jgi:pilus assembly protein CpaC
MNAMTREHGQFYRVRIAGLGIVVIAVWGTLGMQAQALSEAAAISAPTAAIAVPAAVVAPAATIAAPTPTPPTETPLSVRADVTAVAARADAAAAAVAVATPATAVELMVGQSTVLDVGAPITRVSLTSADVADALVTSSRQLLLNGKAPGAISMFVWDREGMLRRYDVVVQRDLTRLTEQISQLFPGESINAHSSGRNIVLSGSVTSKDVIDRAVNVTAGFTDKREEVVSLLQLASPPTNQVLLHVRFAEVSRTALTEVGASLFTSATGIHNTVGRVATQQFPSANFSDLSWSKASSDFGSDVTAAEGKLTFSDFLNLFVLSEKYDLGTLIRALQQKGLFQSLAEPNLVAESGKEASFLAGGEFPIPIAQGSGANIGVSVTFKEFGVRLSFTPEINGDRIHLKVKPEVSTLDFANAVQLGGFRIPALTTRRTETEIELRDRQTFAIAGLLNNTMTNTMSKIPGIGDIPVLGLLFKSKASQKNRTELVVMITPEILRTDSPGAANALPKMEEPYLSPLPQNKSIAPPPPAFPVGAQGAPAQ